MVIKKGLLFVNLGTPNQPTPDAIKPYLSEFLSDRHVVDLPALFWKPILQNIVIPRRLQYIAQHYQDIWLDQQSPLLHYSERLCKKIQNLYPNLHCELSMTYGEPCLKDALNRLKECDVIEVISLYPQYSTTTTLAVINKIKALTKAWNAPPKINYLYDYADHPAYIQALAKLIDQQICVDHPDFLLLSFHGVPLSYIKKRQDQYLERCKLTTQLLKNKIEQYYPKMKIMMTYQSKFGIGKWTTPNTTDVLMDIAQQEKSVAVICPGFAVDCIETLHEIDIENRQYFIQHGGKQFDYIPALNDSELQLTLFSQLIDSLLFSPVQTFTDNMKNSIK